MKKQDFTTTIAVDKTPMQAYEAINNVRGWWSGEIEGPTDRQEEEFTYRYKEFHYSKHKVAELIPGKKIVWLITESSLSFVKDTNEWIGTRIIFDIFEKEGKTQVRFTHEGLGPQLECYDACSNAWTGYITDSLRKFIASFSSEDRSFTTSFSVDKTPKQVFDAINNPRAWWSEDIEGTTDKLQSEFDYHFQEVHRCKLKIVELIPSQKVVWLILDNYFSFIGNKEEWKGTKIIFEIRENAAQTEVRFTHQGLVPEEECYEICNKAWTYYIGTSLYDLIETGKGGPNIAEGNEFEKQREDRPAWENSATHTLNQK